MHGKESVAKVAGGYSIPLVDKGPEPNNAIVDRHGALGASSLKRAIPDPDQAIAHVRTVAFALAPLAGLWLPRGTGIVRYGPERKTTVGYFSEMEAFSKIGRERDLSEEPTQHL